MKLYTSPIGPNPHIARIFFALKKIESQIVEVDMLGLENRQEEYLRVNPAGQVPCLVTDEGVTIAELSAMAEYLDEIKPDPVLTGETAAERALTRTRMRQCDLLIFAPMVLGYRHGDGRKFFGITVHDGIAEPAKSIAQEGLAWLEPLLEGQTYICGERMTYVDIIFFVTVAFFAQQGQPLDPSYKNIERLMAHLEAHDVVGKTA